MKPRITLIKIGGGYLKKMREEPLQKDVDVSKMNWSYMEFVYFSYPDGNKNYQGAKRFRIKQQSLKLVILTA